MKRVVTRVGRGIPVRVNRKKRPCYTAFARCVPAAHCWYRRVSGAPARAFDERQVVLMARCDERLGGLMARCDERLGGLMARCDERLGGLMARSRRVLGSACAMP